MNYKNFLSLFLLSANMLFPVEYLTGAYYKSWWWRNPLTIHYKTGIIDWRPNYPQREPAVGWFSDEQCIIDSEIALAALGKLDFFTFDFYTSRSNQSPGALENNNNGLRFFITSENKRLMNFTIAYMNHGVYPITTQEEWDSYIDLWITYFQDPQYLKINGKPVFIIPWALNFRQQWGGTAGAQQALLYFRQKVILAGFPDLLIGGGIPQPAAAVSNIGIVAAIGFNFLTAYNADYTSLAAGAHNYNVLLSLLPATWNLFKQYSPIPYAPITVQGYDQRPSQVSSLPYLINKTPELFAQQLQLAKDFLDQNPTMLIETKGMIMINAWNEIGLDGALTPTLANGNSYLKQVKNVFG